MNENLNLIEILKNVPKGTKLWTPLAGEVEFVCILDDSTEVYPIKTAFGKSTISFMSDGRFVISYPGQCMLFPSEDQRDWSKFNVPKPKVKYTLHHFDRVLVRDNAGEWSAETFSHYTDEEPHFTTSAGIYDECLPYNEQTARLIGTKKECPIDYEFEFSNDYVPEK